MLLQNNYNIIYIDYDCIDIIYTDASKNQGKQDYHYM